jgi:hypothetical protein
VTVPSKHRLVAVRSAVGRVAEIVGVGAIALIVYFVIPFDGELGEVLAILVVLGSMAALVPLAVRRAGQVLTSDQPVLVAAQSLFTMVTLLIVSFSSLYYVLGVHRPSQIDGIATKIDALYFTVTVLSTVGFGDITATGQGARALVTAHMIVNIVFLAIAVRLLSWALKQRQETNPPTSGPLMGRNR